MTRRLWCVPLGLLLFAVILTGPTAPTAEAQAQFPKTCTSNWCTIDIPDPPATTYVMNNQWNKRGARGSQSVTVYGSSNPDVVWSTTWDWNRKQEWTVTTYPSAITGWHWGWHFPPTGFPVPVSSGKSVTARVAYNYVPHATCGVSRTCRYDVAFDLWFHDTSNPGTNSSPVFELMIWPSYSRADLWIGYTPIAENVDVGGYLWNVFQTTTSNAVFVPTPNQVDVDDATLNLMDFIDEIVTRNLGISPSWYLSSVEFGIEVYKGRGTLNVTSYDVTVGP